MRRREQIMDDRAANGEPYFFIGLPACVVGDDVPLVAPRLQRRARLGTRARRRDRSRGVPGDAGGGPVARRGLHDRQRHHDARPRLPQGHGARSAPTGTARRTRPGSCRPGPFLVPAEFVDADDPHVVLELQRRRDAGCLHRATSLFDVPTLVAAASRPCPLLPGDILLTRQPGRQRPALEALPPGRRRHDRHDREPGHPGRALRGRARRARPSPQSPQRRPPHDPPHIIMSRSFRLMSRNPPLSDSCSGQVRTCCGRTGGEA